MRKQRTIYIFLYYAVLLLLLVLRQSDADAPSIVLRLAFVLATVAPTLIVKRLNYPVIITLFYTISIYGYSYSYMPYTLSLYVVITLGFTLLLKRLHLSAVPPYLLIFTLYFFLIDLFSSAGIGDSSLTNDTLYCFILLVLFLMICERDRRNAIEQIPLCFAVATILLSLFFLTQRNQIILYEVEGMERSGWSDPNYFGTVLGFGTMMGLIKVFSQEWKGIHLPLKLIYLSAIIFSVPVLFLNASRGALLSVIAGFVVLLLFSKAKKSYKVVVPFFAIISVIYLYNNHYLDLLEYRLYSDDGTGSGRTNIWLSKLSSFLDGNFINYFFGYGHTGGLNITGRYIGFHNEFLGFLVDYGFIGLFMLLYFLYQPIKLSLNNTPERSIIISIIVYLVACFLTLEPLLTGILAFFVFYLYAFLLARNSLKPTNV